MERYNTSLTALFAIVLSLMAVNDSWGQQNVDNQDILDYYIDQETNVFPAANGMRFVEDILIPLPDVGEDILAPDTYTISFAGVDATFDGSLTILQR